MAIGHRGGESRVPGMLPGRRVFFQGVFCFDGERVGDGVQETDPGAKGPDKSPGL